MQNVERHISAVFDSFLIIFLGTCRLRLDILCHFSFEKKFLQVFEKSAPEWSGVKTLGGLTALFKEIQLF